MLPPRISLNHTQPFSFLLWRKTRLHSTKQAWLVRFRSDMHKSRLSPMPSRFIVQKHQSCPQKTCFPLRCPHLILAAEFEVKLIGYNDEGIPKTVPPEPENRRNFWHNEFPVLLGYVPNLWRLKEDKTRIIKGIRCKDAFFARAVAEQAKSWGVLLLQYLGIIKGLRSRRMNS